MKKERYKELITQVYFEFKQLYGSPRITAELHSRGYKISRVTVAKYMKEMGLRSKLAKKFKATTDSKHNYQIVENVLNREFEPNNPSWVFRSYGATLFGSNGATFRDTTILDKFYDYSFFSVPFLMDSPLRSIL